MSPHRPDGPLDDAAGTAGAPSSAAWLPHGAAGDPDGAAPADLAARRRDDGAEASLAAAVGALDLCLAIVQPTGVIGYASGALGRMLGGGRGRLAHRPLVEAIPGLAAREPAERLRRTLATGEGCTLRVQHGAGPERRTLGLRASRTEDGRLALELWDATEVARREQLNDRVLEGIDEALVAVDSAWLVTYWNSAAERLTHVGRRTVLGRPLWELWPALRGTMVEQALRATMDDRQPRELSQWHDRPRLGGRVLDLRSFPVHDSGVLVFFTESSGRLRTQRMLAATVEENSLLLEMAARLADTPDSATLLTVLCEIAVRECGARGAGVGAVLGDEVEVLATSGAGLRDCGTVLPLAGSLVARVVTSRRLARWQSEGTMATAAQRISAAGQVGEAMAAPLIAHDQVMGVLIVVRGPADPAFVEREERRLLLVAEHAALALWKSRLLEQTLAASEARSNFLATMSHELRTPLTALTGYGELLADEILGPLAAGPMEMVERMRSVTHDLTNMVDELLTFSSLEAGREQLRVGEVASGDLLQAAVAVVEPLARQKGLAVWTHVPLDAPSLVTDPDKVRQVLVNLAGNAVKFTDRGEVSFSLESDAAEVRFLIRDTGPGIPADGQERIFQPFAQLDSGLTRRHGGTGLGLYIASRLAGILGGRIELASRQGVGSTFALVLPRQRGR
ncbi:MAG: PAS domain-containing sensor histidine kinase [Gemmatimonadaceae bacterium]